MHKGALDWKNSANPVKICLRDDNQSRKVNAVACGVQVTGGFYQFVQEKKTVFLSVHSQTFSRPIFCDSTNIARNFSVSQCQQKARKFKSEHHLEKL